MDQNRKEFLWSAALGTLIGALCGVAIGLSMFKEAKRCEDVRLENQTLREIVTFYQEQPPCGE